MTNRTIIITAVFVGNPKPNTMSKSANNPIIKNINPKINEPNTMCSAITLPP